MPDPLASPAPSLAEFEELARRAFAALPAEVRRACADLLVRVDDFAPDDVLDEMEIEDPYELTGLYDGADVVVRPAEVVGDLVHEDVPHQPVERDVDDWTE